MGSCCSTRRRGTAQLVIVDDVCTSPQQHGPGRRKKKSGVVETDVAFIPGRMFTNSASRFACLYTQQGKKGVNQDAMLVWENFSSASDTIFCGVFDGHGPFGHIVAKRVRDSLPFILLTLWESNAASDVTGFHKVEDNCGTSDDKDLKGSSEIGENNEIPGVYQPLKRYMLKAFKLMDEDLKLCSAIDCFCSGTTAVTLIKQGDNLVIGNLGDSRAILATRDKDNSLNALQLTVDLKPDLPGEAARIQQCKGRVFALQDEPEVARVWLPNNDSPGLAMARAFGDFCLKDFGLISVPDISYRQLTERDEFIILATDGVWDVLSNKEAVNIVASAPSRATAARALVDSATRAWRLKYPTSKNDDCAVVCVFLEHITSSISGGVVENDTSRSPEDSKAVVKHVKNSSDVKVDDYSHGFVLEHSSTLRICDDEIVPVSESTGEAFHVKSQGLPQTKRSLAEYISTAEDDEWSALQGISRVNSLLSLPRFLSGDGRAGSRRKCL